MKAWDAPEPEGMKNTPPIRERLDASSGAGRVLTSPLNADLDEGLDLPVPVALRLQEAGLLVEGVPVQVITKTPPPVRRREPRMYIEGVEVLETPPPIQLRGEAPLVRQRGEAPLVRQRGEAPLVGSPLQYTAPSTTREP